MLFLGREREVKKLAEACESACQGRGALHLVVGEPGIGKTRLADEVAKLATSRGISVAWGRAWETGGAPAFYPWVEVLEALGGEASGAPSLDAHRATHGEGVVADSARERFVLFERVLAFLRERSRASPLLLVFDDLHAADVPSLELLHFVARGLRGRRIAIIGTLRDLEAQRPPVANVIARMGREASHLTLAALASEDVAKLVAEHVGRADEALTSELVTKTDGNPLFVAEALRMLDQRGSWAAPGVLAVITSRIDGLDETTTSLLDAASVFGRRVVPAVLASSTNAALADVVRRLDDVSTRGVLRRCDDGAYLFSHALVRDAFYARIPAPRRRELHRAIARVAEPALAAHHHLAAVPLVSAGEVIRASIAAAAHARARLAPDDAVALLEQTIVAVEGLPASEPERVELLLALGWAATDAGSLARGRQVFHEASRRAATTGDPGLIARAALGQGAELVFGQVRSELVEGLRAALARLDDAAGEHADLRARLLARLAAALQPSTTPEEPVAMAREAMTLAESIDDPRVRAEIALAAGSALTDFAPPLDRIPVSRQLVRDARTLDDGVVELRGLTRLATDYIEIGDFAEAESVIEARAELAARVGHPRYLWQTPLLRSMLAMPRGAFTVCDESIEEATAIGQEGLDVNAAHVVAMHRFWMLLAREDLDGLRAHMPEVLRAMGRMPEPAQHHALAQAVLHARAGEASRAKEALAGIGDGKRMLAPMMRATIADVALRCDDAARFPQLLAELEPARGRNTAWGPFGFTCGPPYDVLVGSLLARLGRRDEAGAAFDAALALARRSGATANEAWVHRARREALSDTTGVTEVRAPAAAQQPPPRLEFTLRVEGNDVIVRCDGRTTRLRSVRGLPMLVRLVEEPGREMHVLDLASEPDDENVVDRGDAGEVFDAKAREAYQKRIADLRAEIDDADRSADVGRADRARRELDMLVQQLSSAVGLGGRARRVGSAAERARITVQRRVREAIKKIGQQEPDLGRHLDWAIRTGTFCAYEPRGRKTAS
ncbi:MAG: AAA family ATPase [Labilithrix sp.]|nr:AAA family ATPase [Labilithrix sp.]MCW5816526.1 AAA family ATPase [Labilithrix sp.]